MTVMLLVTPLITVLSKSMVGTLLDFGPNSGPDLGSLLHIFEILVHLRDVTRNFSREIAVCIMVRVTEFRQETAAGFSRHVISNCW